MSEFKDYFQKLKSSFSASAIDKAFTLEDEYKIYEQVYKSYKNGQVDDGIWAKALTLVKDRELAEGKYIQLKVEKTTIEIKADEQIREEWMEELSIIIQRREEEKIYEEKRRQEREAEEKRKKEEAPKIKKREEKERRIKEFHEKMLKEKEAWNRKSIFGNFWKNFEKK
tara:strand:- start:405 stop:911 length:507 start_codon:yes stop_codon:yes gene_type:complete